MNLKNTFLRGTLLLTAAGTISRCLGFYYRIFLANTIGAEGIGIYQLIFPIYGICFSLCASGIETAVSKLTAEKYALQKPREATHILETGVLLTLTLSLSCSLVLYEYAQPIAHFFLKEPRCTELLKLLAFSIPLGTVQSCICGYYFGIHQAAVPSFSQLIEQGFRIGVTMLLYKIYTTNALTLSPLIAVAGLLAGEFSSLLFTLTCFSFQRKLHILNDKYHFRKHFQEIRTLAAPLTLSRISVTLLVSLESTLIPLALKSYGLTSSDALRLYGTLNGMALPFILFPNAITSSLSLMLLPKISEFQASMQIEKLKNTIRKTFAFCFLLGFLCLVFFFFFGNFLGCLVFSNPSAGHFLRVLAWICPFLYLNTTLSSILNGLGRTTLTFFHGIFGLTIRILFIILTVPHLGIYGYLLGLLTSQIYVTTSTCIALKKFLFKK